MKIGMPILFEYNSIEDNIKLAKELNLDFIELNLNFDYCCYELISNKNLKKSLEESSLETTVHFYDEADFASYDEVVSGYFKLFKKYLRSLKKINVKMVNVHLNLGPIVTISGVKNYMYEKEYNSYILRLKKNLEKMTKMCQKIGAKLVLENVLVPQFLKQTYVDLKNDFYFNYDIGHDNNDNDNILHLLESEKIKFLEFHIHDGNKKTCHLALGEGEIDISKYKEMAKDAYVVLEVKSSYDLKKSVAVFKNL